ncbi:MAG: phosphoribosylformylglycinamidine synthase, partial [Gammaproteobacteria bacterium]|nr:phosphoribosylformylglycinamidine synthase [Gammaproteobacteria bacterium]
MSTVSCLLGGTALSSFRKNKLLETLRASGVECASLSARWCYLVEHEAPLSSSEKRLAEQLLDAKLTASLEQTGLHLVTPRLGTISPWSSKATDIFRGCGLDAVLRVERATAAWTDAPPADNDAIHACLHDRMTQSVLPDLDTATRLFDHHAPRPLQRIPVSERGSAALQEADRDLGLALSEDEIQYLVDAYHDLDRDPTDAELMMFAQANSEHCRHKIFNASWTLNGTRRDETLFGMIRNTHATSPRGVLSAYHDNSAVLAGFDASRLFPDPTTNVYRYEDEPVAMQIKVETHNHPTAISPFPGAATGSGGEIRDEAAT